ncbi:hypothetical protein RRG08_048893 [Elysia crispata]|uniref:Uncharacterized protein n=1 Tax=Elysia crispata TaxID=231223 RepID=A0AAE0YTN7_9GAST|nr:hypothetical protein RRG08_048893 [Elysia crispata]
MSFNDFLGAVSFLLIALVVSESQGEVVPSRNSSTGLTAVRLVQRQLQQRSPTCPYGKYFDTVNNACLDVPLYCPNRLPRDSVLGCLCKQGQVFDGRLWTCVNSNQQLPLRSCPREQYYDSINRICYNLPTRCPLGASLDNLLGCRCPPSQTYDGRAGVCQTTQEEGTCPSGQFFDSINKRCYTLPYCPGGATFDATVGCRCPRGETFNSQTGLCQSTQPGSNNCLQGEFFDSINKRCSNIPRVCPPGSMSDAILGCRCPHGETFNGVTNLCQIDSRPKMCSDDYYFDIILQLCDSLPISCPRGSQSDYFYGCLCPKGQTYNGATRQCQTSTQQMPCPNGQYFDTLNKICYYIPRTCPRGSVYDFNVGCRCPQRQIYNGATELCDNQNLDCPAEQYFDTINNMCYNFPTFCPTGSLLDATLGCRCPEGQSFNGATEKCQNDNQIESNDNPRMCPEGYYFDTVLQFCYSNPRDCPQGSQRDNFFGCLCPKDQTFNGHRWQCQNSQQQQPCPRGQYFDTINRMCYYVPRSCPQGSVYNVRLGCLCPQSQMYNGAIERCV